MTTLPDHLRKYVEDAIKEHIHKGKGWTDEGQKQWARIDFYAGATALYQKLVEMSDDEKDAINIAAYNYSISPGWKYDENYFTAGAKFGLLLNRVKKGDGHE